MVRPTLGTDIRDGRVKYIEETKTNLNQLEKSSFHSGMQQMTTSKWSAIFLKPSRWPAAVVIAILDLYRATLGVSLGGQCRFYPSCSSYARLAIIKYGLIRGGAKSLWRLARCNPFNLGGIDEP